MKDNECYDVCMVIVTVEPLQGESVIVGFLLEMYCGFWNDCDGCMKGLKLFIRALRRRRIEMGQPVLNPRRRENEQNLPSPKEGTG